MKIDGELILMGFIPALISAGTIVSSFLLVMRKRMFLNALLFIINVSLNSFALSMFIPMLQGTYPTFLPHIIVLLTIPILVVQLRLHKK